VIDLPLYDIRRRNLLKIFKSILNGNDTVKTIHSDTGIGQLTVWECTKTLTEMRLIDVTRPKQETRGRRTMHFSVSGKFYAVYFIEHNENFSCLALNSKDKVVARFEHVKRRDFTTLKDSVKAFCGKIRKIPDFYRYCVGVYGTCSEKVATLMPKSFNLVSKEDLIIEGFSSEDKISLIKINDKITVSYNGRLYNPPDDVDVENIKKVAPIDEYCEYEGELFYGIYDALIRIISKNMLKLI